MSLLFWKKKRSDDVMSDKVMRVEEISSHRAECNYPVAETMSADEKIMRKMAGSKLNKSFAVFEQVNATANKLIDVYNTSLIVEQNIEAIRGATAVQLANISARFQLQQTALEHIFGQRQQGLNAHFETLNRALNSDDREEILASLRGISSIVTSSPLQDFEKFSEAWESNNLVLDF